MRFLFMVLILFSQYSLSKVEEFVEPRVEGLRMDRCLTWAKQCDKPAANEWCIQHNYTKSIYWEISNNIAEKQPTKMLLSKGICNAPSCDAFKTIVCYQ